MDLIILITTRSSNILDDSAAHGFFHNDARNTVDPSRTRHGLYVIADFWLLLRHELWSRFLTIAVSVAKTVLPAYVDSMVGQVAHDDKGLLLVPDGCSLVADSAINQQWR